MKKIFMILFSFLFVSTAFVGGSLLLSGCNSSNVSENLPSNENPSENNPLEENPGGGGIVA